MNMKEVAQYLIDKWKNKDKSIVEKEGFYVETDVFEDVEDKSNKDGR